jgi:hypothetical protein
MYREKNCHSIKFKRGATRLLLAQTKKKKLDDCSTIFLSWTNSRQIQIFFYVGEKPVLTSDFAATLRPQKERTLDSGKCHNK